MTNAERQKRYRDKKRGGPPVGRWGGRVPVKTAAEVYKVGRTLIFMSSWIAKHAPDVSDEIRAGRARVTPAYKRLRAEYMMGLARAVQDAPKGASFFVTRRDGRFVFEWET